MTLNNCRRSQPLKEGECGGCGTFENVTDNSCVECAKGYPEPTLQEMGDANEYYENHIKPLAKVIDEAHRTACRELWKRLRTPVDYSLKAELEKAEEDGSTFRYGQDFNPSCMTIPDAKEDEIMNNEVLKPGYKPIDLYGGLKRSEMVILSTDPTKRNPK